MNKSCAYYNEFDKHAAAWLRELINDGLIAHGEVDERSIVDVEANDLRGYSQHHFFAGIGGWSYALRLSNWPDELAVWTASLPCQPFSAAGKGLGKSDERHLLPHFLELVRQCKPSIIFGEQVKNSINHGWLDDLYSEMETCGYSIGSSIIGAHSIGAPHIRQRLYWLGITNSARSQQRIKTAEITRHRNSAVTTGCDDIRLADNISEGLQKQSSHRTISSEKNGNESRKDSSGSCRLVNTQSNCERRHWKSEESHEKQEPLRRSSVSSIEWIFCIDGKHRPIESGIFPLVNRVSPGMVPGSNSCLPFDENNTEEARVLRLKGYGNAIVPQVAAQFIGAFMDVMNG